MKTIKEITQLELCPLKYKPQQANKDSRVMTLQIKHEYLDAVRYVMMNGLQDKTYTVWLPEYGDYMKWIHETIQVSKSYEVLSAADWRDRSNQHYLWLAIVPFYVGEKFPNYENISFNPMVSDPDSILSMLREKSSYLKSYQVKHQQQLQPTLPTAQKILLDSILEF